MSRSRVKPFREEHQLEYGLEVASRNPTTKEVDSVRCKFNTSPPVDWFHCGGYSSPFGERRRDGICPDSPGRITITTTTVQLFYILLLVTTTRSIT